MNCRFMAVLAIVVLGLPSSADAWHRDGHMTIARMAWKQLDAGQQLRIAKLLKAHPHYEIFLADGRPKDLATEPEWAFAQASVWSDWVRDPRGPGLDAATKKKIKAEFNKPVWHYVNLPYIHPDDTGKFDAAAIRKTILEPALDEKGEPRHVIAALEFVTKKLRAADTTDPDRAVALCWLAHLVGDLHQPLHGTSLIGSIGPFDPPHGDLGGNRLSIKVKPDSKRAVNLHFYWDSLLFSDEPGFAGVDGMAAKWLNDPKFQRDQFPELKSTDYLKWAEESLELAKTVVYQGKDGFLKARALSGKKGDLSDVDVPVLPEGYQETAEKTAARRMVLAAYRLTDQLQIAFAAK